MLFDEKNENEEVQETTEETVEETVEATVEETTEEIAETVEEVTTKIEEVAEAATEEVVEAKEEVTTEVEEVVEEVVAATEEEEDSAEVDGEESSDEEEEEEDELVLEEEEVVGESAHDDFNWAAGNKRISAYSEEETAKYLEQYEETMTRTVEGKIVSGNVVAINGGDVILDFGFKSDGLLAMSEFRDLDELNLGDSVEVYVEQQEDEKGQLVLSRRKAKLLRAWERIKDSYENGTVIKGTVISKTKGGLIVDAGGLETFLPGSQIDIKPIVDYDSYVGKQMEFKVVKVNEAIKNAVVSHKALIESDLAEQREAIIAGLERGQVLEGLVKNITDFGAFLDLGGVDGLLYITDISWGRINHPSEILKLNDRINVVVLDFDENKKRISLGMKQLHPHPWDVLNAEIKEGSVVKGKIVNIEDYGAFL
ncbi:MAG: S1 RNA-binding domain-containing protein, partial [Bacteroidota bacterium]